MVETDYIKIGIKIKQARIKHQLTQEQLSEKCDISTSYLGHIERGTRKLSVDTLVSLCSALELSTDYVLLDVLPSNDSVIIGLLEHAKQNKAKSYERYLRVIKALSEVMDKL
ncbi:transcriptional regulator with XRE-family HTH domain [Anaerotaenia torta]|uniref:helix-turn-helix domain-containing protein n=1 Tax=Anaerotaenia torta TaxID=433293 RepID=UPI003D22758C